MASGFRGRPAAAEEEEEKSPQQRQKPTVNEGTPTFPDGEVSQRRRHLCLDEDQLPL